MPHTPGHRNQRFDPFAFQNAGFGRLPSQQQGGNVASAAANVASLNPAGVALQGGGAIAAAIADYLAGGESRKDRGFGRQALKGQLGKPIFSPSNIAGQRKLSFIQSARPLAARANQRLGLGSGRAQQELISQFAGQEGDLLAELIRREAELRSRRDVNIGSQFFAAGR